MKQNNQPNNFYQEVDRARYRANWSCLAWFFAVGVVLVVGGWLLARHYGWL